MVISFTSTSFGLVKIRDTKRIPQGLTATSYNREPNFPILKKIPIPDYDAILKGPTQLEKPPKDFWLGCPWAGLRPKTRVTQILVLKLKNALPKPYDELVKKILYQNYNPQMVV